METLESKVSETILQEKKIIVVGAHSFEMAKITMATLIKVSGLISLLPTVTLDKDKFIYESLSIAKDCRMLGTIAATMLLGVQKEPIIPQAKNKLLQWLKIGNRKSKYEELGESLLLTLSPAEFEMLVVELIKGMELQFFFQISTSLLEVNLLRKTK